MGKKQQSELLEELRAAQLSKDKMGNLEAAVAEMQANEAAARASALSSQGKMKALQSKMLQVREKRAQLEHAQQKKDTLTKKTADHRRELTALETSRLDTQQQNASELSALEAQQRQCEVETQSLKLQESSLHEEHAAKEAALSEARKQKEVSIREMQAIRESLLKELQVAGRAVLEEAPDSALSLPSGSVGRRHRFVHARWKRVRSGTRKRRRIARELSEQNFVAAAGDDGKVFGAGGEPKGGEGAELAELTGDAAAEKTGDAGGEPSETACDQGTGSELTAVCADGEPCVLPADNPGGGNSEMTAVDTGEVILSGAS